MHDKMADPRCGSARRVIANFRELATLSTSHGLQRVAWGPVWRWTRGWLHDSATGLSHSKEEDTPDRHLEMAISAFLLLVEKTVASAARN